MDFKLNQWISNCAVALSWYLQFENGWMYRVEISAISLSFGENKDVFLSVGWIGHAGFLMLSGYRENPKPSTAPLIMISNQLQLVESCRNPLHQVALQEDLKHVRAKVCLLALCHYWQRPVEDAFRKKAWLHEVTFWSILSCVLLAAAWLPPYECPFQTGIF